MPEREIFPFGQAHDVLAGFGELIAEAPNELTVQTGFLSAPDGTPVLFFMPTWSGTPSDGAPGSSGRGPHLPAERDQPASLPRCGG